MSDVPDQDPFADDSAREREARRRERAERRKARSTGVRRSLGERVSGALGGVGDAVTGAGKGTPPAAEPAAPPPAAVPPAAAPAPAAPAPAAEQPAPAAPPPAADPAPAVAAEPVAPAAGEAPSAASPGGVTDDWLADFGTGENDPITSDWELSGSTAGAWTQTDDTPAVEPKPAAGGGGGSGRDGVPVVGNRPRGRDPHTIWLRRLAALAIAFIALGLVLFAAKKIHDHNQTPPPVPKGPRTLKTTDVVIPEGLTIKDMADVAKKAGLKGDYEKAVKKAMKKFPLKKYDAQDAPSMEGFLFPATYEVEKGAPVSDLVSKQLEAFQQYFDPIDLSYAKKKNLTPYDVIKIASMIEKEAQVDKDRPKVAAVIYNRLAAGDFLGIDATLRYGLDKYSGQLLESELESDNPYNTRTNAGLPPTPISNPGVASLKAAANPAKTDDYYFVVKPGDCSGMYFTNSQAKFDAAAAKYQAALQAEGHSPTNC